MATPDLVSKKEYAELLYLKTSHTLKEIADKVGVTHNTVRKWAVKEKWKEKKARIIITRGEELNRIYEQLNNINNRIMIRVPEDRYATNREADIISKLTAAARNLETQVSIADIVDVFQDFIEWLRDIDLNKAKEMSTMMDNFIKDKMK